jgi:hypothetical protein
MLSIVRVFIRDYVWLVTAVAIVFADIITVVVHDTIKVVIGYFA